MHISPALAAKTQELIAGWTTEPSALTAALDSFVGDIYSGLQASSFTESDREYANTHLRILSGLYGILRPLDGIAPYRLEMAYKIPGAPFASLYEFWGKKIAETLPNSGTIINVSSVEYTQAVLPYVEAARVVTPRFLTINPATNEPTFVVVHAKIARGAFAHWLIVNRVEALSALRDFADIGYHYDTEASTPQEPVFVCQEFGGKGLSMRLT